MQNKNFYQNRINERRKEKNEKITNLFKSKEIIEKKVPKFISEKKSQTRLEAIYSWKAREFEKINRHPKWYLYFYIVLFALCTYALIINNLLLSILVILFGLIFYFLEKRTPKIYSFGITKEGVFVQDTLYLFSSIENFWIFYEPNGIKELSLKNRKNILPFTQIPLGEADPRKIREILVNFLPEKKREQTIWDLIERFF